MTSELNEKIKKVIEDVLKIMNIDFEEVVVDEDFLKQTRFIIKTKESNTLIGNKGEVFLALNHLIKRLISDSNTDENIRFSIDINDYQESNTKNVINKAKILAERARFFKTEAEMEPMSSYERMIVHTLFSEDPEIKTESSGQGKFRRVVIKYLKKEDN